MEKTEMIFNLLEKASRIPIEAIKSKNRKRELVRVRQVFYHACNGCDSLVNLGKYFKQDHATVLHARKQIQNLIDTNDKDTVDLVTRLDNEIKQQIKKEIRLKSENFLKLKYEIWFNSCNMSKEAFFEYLNDLI